MFEKTIRKINLDNLNYLHITLDKFLFIIGFFSFLFFRPDYVVFVSFILLFPYLYFTKRIHKLDALLLSSTISLAWVYFANSFYYYNFETLTIYGLNGFPLFAWAIGLFTAYLIYSNVQSVFEEKSLIHKFFLFSLPYWFFLILLESIAYHLFNLQNISTQIYSGLPICNCIHAPDWMKISYFLLGPIYFFLIELLGIEDKTNL